MKFYLLFTLTLITFSCDQIHKEAKTKIELNSQSNYKPHPQSVKLSKRALEITMFHRDDSIKVDSTILLLDQATEIDSLNFTAYWNKVQFLMIKQDFPRLLQTNLKLIALRPNMPGLIIQRGIILELSGEIKAANIEYSKGIKEFEKNINSESDISLDFQIEYVNSLVMANNYEKALRIFNALKKENPDSEILKDYKLQTKNEVLHLMTEKRT